MDGQTSDRLLQLVEPRQPADDRSTVASNKDGFGGWRL